MFSDLKHPSSSGKTELQLRKCVYQIGPWAYLCSILLISDWCEQCPSWAGHHSLYGKVADVSLGYKPLSSVPPVFASVLPQNPCPPWVPGLTFFSNGLCFGCQTNPFLPSCLWSWSFTTAAESKLTQLTTWLEKKSITLISKSDKDIIKIAWKKMSLDEHRCKNWINKDHPPSQSWLPSKDVGVVQHIHHSTRWKSKWENPRPLMTKSQKRLEVEDYISAL